ncbi:MAG: YafY family transcriptional regulator [Chloroflexi bacterium]|nr:YafY family transcriptional regulator [Chloroflexota bacterium]
MNRVDRLMAYLLLFQSRGLMRAQDFARRFEISERTVYRDIQALGEVGVPIVAMPGEGYRLMPGYYLPPIAFSPEEARALFLAVSMLSGFTTAGDTQKAAQAALEKIRAVLPAATLRQAEALQAIIRFFAFPNSPLDFDDPRFLRLQEAIHRRQVVHLRYHAQHSNEVTERDVEPMQLVMIDKAWVLSAYCRLRQGARAFRLDRIDKLTLRQEQFTPRDLGVQIPQPGPLRIVVRFDASIVRWVRERQHYSLDETETAAINNSSEEGDALMVYRPRSFDQIEGWLFSWGEKVEILEPAELRRHMAKIARRILAQHS